MEGRRLSEKNTKNRRQTTIQKGRPPKRRCDTLIDTLFVVMAVDTPINVGTVPLVRVRARHACVLATSAPPKRNRLCLRPVSHPRPGQESPDSATGDGSRTKDGIFSTEGGGEVLFLSSSGLQSFRLKSLSRRI